MAHHHGRILSAFDFSMVFRKIRLVGLKNHAIGIIYHGFCPLYNSTSCF